MPAASGLKGSDAHSRSTLYRKVEAGEFPRQVQIAKRCVGWRESAIQAWLANPMFYSVDEDALTF